MALSFVKEFPEELIDRIFRSVDDRATLHALCLVSLDMNRIATTHLYSRISLEKNDFQHLRPLALLLWTSEKHRNAVRSFSVRRAYGGNLEPWPKHPDLGDIIQQQIKLYVREGDAEQWYHQVRDGPVDPLPIASLLLRSLPHVMEMQFDGFQLVDPSLKDCRTLSYEQMLWNN